MFIVIVDFVCLYQGSLHCSLAHGDVSFMSVFEHFVVFEKQKDEFVELAKKQRAIFNTSFAFVLFRRPTRTSVNLLSDALQGFDV